MTKEHEGMTKDRGNDEKMKRPENDKIDKVNSKNNKIRWRE